MWEYIPFENCLEKTKIKFKLAKKDYKESGKYPIVSQEASLISGYHNDISYIFKVAKPIVVFGDHTQALKYIDFDFIVGADGVKILQPKKTINPKYFYYVLKALMPKTTGYARHYKLLKKLDIPVLPLTEQERIVAKLDAAFAKIDEAVENANTKEFEINKLQASILCASMSTNAIKSELTPITELCNAIYAGGDAPAKVNISKVKTKKYKTPIYSNGVKDSGLYGYTTSEPRTLQPAITISARGTIGHIELRNKPFLPIVRLIVLEPKIEKIDLTFLKFALLSMKIFSSGSSIPQLTVPMLKKINLSLPPLAEQKQIVKKLNTAYREFENACIFIEKSRQSYKSLKSAILAQELQSSQGEAA